jgi:hypothetical protein
LNAFRTLFVGLEPNLSAASTVDELDKGQNTFQGEKITEKENKSIPLLDVA